MNNLQQMPIFIGILWPKFACHQYRTIFQISFCRGLYRILVFFIHNCEIFTKQYLNTECYRNKGLLKSHVTNAELLLKYVFIQFLYKKKRYLLYKIIQTSTIKLPQISNLIVICGFGVTWYRPPELFFKYLFVPIRNSGLLVHNCIKSEHFGYLKYGLIFRRVKFILSAKFEHT